MSVRWLPSSRGPVNAAMRLLLLATIAMLAALSAAEHTQSVTMDDLYGRWIPAATTTAPPTDPPVVLTLRVARITLGDDRQFSGMWRLDDATPAAGTIVIFAAGAEHRVPFTFDGKTLTVTDTTPKMALVKAP